MKRTIQKKTSITKTFTVTITTAEVRKRFRLPEKAAIFVTLPDIVTAGPEPSSTDWELREDDGFALRAQWTTTEAK